jgi:hypothetical protein
VLLVAVAWDGQFPGFVEEPALGPLVNAAQSAGVPILPVLLVEGRESILGTAGRGSGARGGSWWLQGDKHQQQLQEQQLERSGPEWLWGLGGRSRGIVGEEARRSLGGKGPGLPEVDGTHKEVTGMGRGPMAAAAEDPKVWKLEDAPRQLADALGVPVSRVCVVQVPTGVGAAAGDLSCLSRMPGEQQWQLYEGLQQVKGTVRLLLQELYGRQVVPPQAARL